MPRSRIEHLAVSIVGVTAAAALAAGAFGSQIESPGYALPFTTVFRAMFCAGALIAGVSFAVRQYLVGTLAGAAASAVSVVLFVQTRIALADAGLAPPAHTGWGFSFTVPAFVGFASVLVWHEVRYTRPVA